MSIAEHTHLTPEAYLESESTSEIKHEYIAGDVWAMVGATDKHVSIAGNLFFLLKQALKGRPCTPYISDMKVQVETADAYFYPDVLVTCDPRDKTNYLAKQFPSFIAEVLSPSTEAYDRGKKFGYYRQLDSLQSYWLIDTESLSVDCFNKNAQDEWVLHSYTSAEQVIELPSLNMQVALTDLYDEIEFGE